MGQDGRQDVPNLPQDVPICGAPGPQMDVKRTKKSPKFIIMAVVLEKVTLVGGDLVHRAWWPPT